MRKQRLMALLAALTLLLSGCTSKDTPPGEDESLSEELLVEMYEPPEPTSQFLPANENRIKSELPVIILGDPLLPATSEDFMFRPTPDAEPGPFPLESSQFSSRWSAYQADLNNDGVYEAYATSLVGSGNPWLAISGYDPVTEETFSSTGRDHMFVVHNGELLVSVSHYLYPSENDNPTLSLSMFENHVTRYYHPVPNPGTGLFDYEAVSDELAADLQRRSLSQDTQLSAADYPEWIYLSENFHSTATIYSPIDHDYNQKTATQDFIDSSTYEFIDIWQNELALQYEKTLHALPAEQQALLAEQQTAWQTYEESDVFAVVGVARSYGYTRENALKILDRARTIELLQIQYLLDVEPSFFYESKPSL